MKFVLSSDFRPFDSTFQIILSFILEQKTSFSVLIIFTKLLTVVSPYEGSPSIKELFIFLC